MKSSSQLPSSSLEESKTMMESRLPTVEKPWMENYGILLKQDGESNLKMIGAVGIPRMSELGAEIGYGIHSDYWGVLCFPKMD
jgi:RimJ/RimL family protein N-acetyltransferase